MDKTLETHWEPAEMADPNDVEDQTEETPASQSADDRFAALVSKSRGLRSDLTGESVAGESLVEKALNLKPIRSRFMTTVFPIILVPLLLMGLLAIAGLGLLGQQTNEAASDTDSILAEHNEAIAEELGQASDGGAGFVDGFLSTWFERVSAIDGSSVDASEVAQQISSTEFLSEQNVTDETALLGQDNVQVVFTNEAGEVLSSSHPDTTLESYASADWFTNASQGDQFRSFVNDGEHIESLEFSRQLADGNLVRVRVPLANLQTQLDRATDGQNFDLSIVDNAAGVVLGDTSTDHAEGSVFIAGDVMDATASGVDFDSLDADFSAGDERVFANVNALTTTSAEEFPFTGVDWTIQASEPLDSISVALLGFQDVAVEVNEQQRILSVGLALIMAVTVAVAFFALRRSARQISEPVEQLSVQAQAAADVGIPSIVEAARTSEELPELDEFTVDSNDELTILAASLNTMQGAAVDLAAGQAQLRRQNVSRTFVSLGRRNQNLLNRQLEFIEELESQERDPDALENLFRLDHLATRMRRNAENLLVLAGEQTPRRWGKPIAVRDVLRAAASEIADYRRVRLGDIDPATVSGNLATDLSHLFAELLENAGSFSPPTTPIEVFGQHAESHYRLAIVDQGIGMDDDSLAEINERLANPVDFADAPSAYLGLFVVSRLAQEMGVTVRLSNADPTGEGHRRGTIAFIDLPNALLSADAATEQSDQKSSEAVSRRTDAVDAAPGTGVGIEETAKTIEAAPPVSAPEPVLAEAPPASEPVGTTSAGFPKRSKGATNVKTEPDKFVSDTPANAEETPAPAAEAPATPVAEATTSAGFPKRSKGATSIQSVPDKFVSDTPVNAEGQKPIERDAKTSAIALVNAAKAKAKRVAAEEAAATTAGTAVAGAAVAGAAVAGAAVVPDAAVVTNAAVVADAAVVANAAVVAPAAAVPDAAVVANAAVVADVPTTAAGFPKRGESKSNSSIPAPIATREAAPPRSRDADAVKNSLMSYRSAVARGRGEGQGGNTPSETAAPATVGAADQDNDDARPGSA